MNRYKLLGVNDEATTCSVCGRLELKKVMWLSEIDEGGFAIGEPFHTGTTCGAKLMGLKISIVNRVVKNFDATLSNKRDKVAAEYMRVRGEFQLWKELDAVAHTFATRKDHPIMHKIKALQAEARAHAAATVTGVEIE